MVLNQIINFCNYKLKTSKSWIVQEQMSGILKQIDYYKNTLKYDSIIRGSDMIFNEPGNQENRYTFAFGGLKEYIEEMPMELQTYE